MKKYLNIVAAALIGAVCVLPSSLVVHGEDDAAGTSPEPSSTADAAIENDMTVDEKDDESSKDGTSNDVDESSKIESSEKEDGMDASSTSDPSASPSSDASQEETKTGNESDDLMLNKIVRKAQVANNNSDAFTLTLQNNDGTIAKKNDSAAGTLSSDQKTLTIADGLKPNSDELDTLNQYRAIHDGTEAYIFDGWFADDGTMIYRPYGKNANDGFYWKLDKYAGEKDLTLHAQWTKAAVLNYDGNGGTAGNPMPVYKFDPSKSFSLTPNTYLKEGYAFAGWNTAANGTGTAYQDGQNVKLSGSTTLYAQWIPAKQTIYQASGGGTFTIANESLDRYQYKFSERNFFPHYVSSIGNGKVYDSDDLKDGLTVTNTRMAVITFDKNSEGASGDEVSQQVPLNEKTVLNGNPYIWNGYIFSGWNTKADGTGDAYDPKQQYSFGDDITLYAQWLPLKQSEKITYGNDKKDAVWERVSDGSLKVPSDSDIYSAKFYESAQLRYSSDAQKWSPKTEKDLAGTDQDQLTVTNSKKYPVYFHGNGADNDSDGMPVPQYFGKNETASLITNLFTKKGYAFNGWKVGTEKDGKVIYEDPDPYTVDYGNAASFTENMHSDQGINLYAQWVPLKKLQDGSDGAGTYHVTLDKSDNDSKNKNVWNHSVDLPDDTAENTYDIAKIYENSPDYYESSNDSDNPAAIRDGNVTITNTNVTSSLTIENHVTGNFGSRSKPFRYTVTLAKGSEHPITGSKFTVTVNGEKQDVSLNAKGQMELNLSSGDIAVITPLYNGTSFSVVESDYKSDGYEVTDKNTSGVLNSDMTAVFTNNRAMEIPTGLSDVLGRLWWIIPVVAAAIVGFCANKRRRKHKGSQPAKN